MIAAGDQFYCMTSDHNTIVWRFIHAASHRVAAPISVVRNDDQNNMVGGYSQSGPLSSGGDPGANLMNADLPVLIFDPAGVELPRRFV